MFNVTEASVAYASDNSDSGGCAMQLHLDADLSGWYEWASASADGVPFAKDFRRNESAMLHISKGTLLRGVYYIGRSSGQGIFEFCLNNAWFRTYEFDLSQLSPLEAGDQ